MDQMQLVAWTFRMTQAEQSRAAHRAHVRRERAREAMATRSAGSTMRSRARAALATMTRSTRAAAPTAQAG